MLTLEATAVAVATLSGLATGIGEALTWFWGIFTDLMQSIASNPLMLWGVGFAIVAGVIGLALKVVRKFGIKSRR